MASATTKQDMIKRVAAETELPRNEVRQIAQAFLDAIIDELAHGKRLEFREFGVFEVVTRKPRVARNPRTGEAIHVPAKTVVHFKQGRVMRKRVAAYGETLLQQKEAEASGGPSPEGETAQAGLPASPGGETDAPDPPPPAESR